DPGLHEAIRHRKAGDQKGAPGNDARHLHFARRVTGQTLQETGDPSGAVKLRWTVLVLVVATARWTGAAPVTLPIYIEDNHAGSFYWLAEHLDVDEEYTLIHFDVHSDASAIFDLDTIRERILRVSSLEDRRELLTRWRATGA